MGRVNVYLPDDLAEAAHAAGLNLSRLTQEATRRELQRTGVRGWLAEVSRLPPARVGHAAVQEAIDSAREELGGAHG
ncbi:MAG: type II toxin-antitoxin system CcdA family antitoxin [Candidatus Dormibacteria bacterium]